MSEKILSQLLKIRDLGRTNMFDYRVVQRIAFDHGYYELVIYIEEDPRRYCYFIMNGKEPETDTYESTDHRTAETSTGG